MKRDVAQVVDAEHRARKQLTRDTDIELHGIRRTVVRSKQVGESEVEGVAAQVADEAAVALRARGKRGRTVDTFQFLGI